MSDIKEAKRLLGEEGRPNRPDFDRLNNLSHVARLSRQEHISIQEAMEYIKHMEQASAGTLSLLENMKEGVWVTVEQMEELLCLAAKIGVEEAFATLEPPGEALLREALADDLLETSDHPDDLNDDYDGDCWGEREPKEDE